MHCTDSYKIQIPTNWPLKKLNQKKYGLFTTKEKIEQEVYKLKLLKRWAIYDIFNEDLFIHCKETEFTSQHKDLAPPPDIVNKEEEYKVEEIKGHYKKERNV